MKKIIYSFVVFIALLTLSGCGAISGIQVPDNFKGDLPKKAKLDVDRIYQNDNYSCATTSLAMLMNYQDGKDITYDKNIVWDKSGSTINSVRKEGNDINGLNRIADTYGFENYEFIQGLSIDELKYLITQDIPVLINIRNYYSRGSHAVVVIGYDEKGFFINDPSNRWHADGYHIDMATFKTKWWANLSFPRGKAYNSAFVVYKN